VNQDVLGVQGRRVSRDGNREVWVKPLSGGGRAVVLFNRGEQPETIAVGWEALGYPTTLKANIRDLWTHKDLKPVAGRYSTAVPGHGVVMLRVRP
jgi:alpha-galactosidase